MKLLAQDGGAEGADAAGPLGKPQGEESLFVLGVMWFDGCTVLGVFTFFSLAFLLPMPSLLTAVVQCL